MSEKPKVIKKKIAGIKVEYDISLLKDLKISEDDADKMIAKAVKEAKKNG